MAKMVDKVSEFPPLAYLKHNLNIHLTLITLRWKRIGKIIRDFSGRLLVTTR